MGTKRPRAVTRKQMRELDRIAIEEYAIPGQILMENAGRACARAAREMLADVWAARVVVFCGRGNNGGDGFVVARHLTNWGGQVQVLLLGHAEHILQQGGEAAVNLRIIRNMDVPVLELDDAEAAAQAVASVEADLVVDALLGTGASGEVREPFRSVIAAINQLETTVLAVDIPSGLDCDSGEPLGIAVRADRTVTFAAMKLGFGRGRAGEYTGRVQVAEISIPRREIERMPEAGAEASTAPF
ncbi:MAG: NAD(P)H-hydrate epimerase [Planctomycetes bacterium]|nr:NAD(P)H-hydrate epimerase [Planctomycetota bacterium]